MIYHIPDEYYIWTIAIVARVIVAVVHQHYITGLIDVFMNIKTDNYSLLHATAMITYYINIIIK